MKNAFAIGLISGLIGGLAGVAGTQFLSPPAASGVDGQSASTALNPPTEEDGQLASELSELRRQNGELSMRLAALENGSRQPAREAVANPEVVDLAKMQEELAALAAAFKDPQSASSAGLRNMVAGALKEVQAEESEQRQIEREQRSIDRIVEQMDNYAQELGLNGVQRKDMQSVLIVSSTKRDELFAAMREGTVPRDGMREAFTTMREETNTALQSILTPQQYEEYGTMGNDRGFGRGGDGGRAGRGGPGGR